MTHTQKHSKIVRSIIRGLPLAGAAASVFLPLRAWVNQFMVLIVLLWFQVYFLLDFLFAGR